MNELNFFFLLLYDDTWTDHMSKRRYCIIYVLPWHQEDVLNSVYYCYIWKCFSAKTMWMSGSRNVEKSPSIYAYLAIFSVSNVFGRGWIFERQVIHGRKTTLELWKKINEMGKFWLGRHNYPGKSKESGGMNMYYSCRLLQPSCCTHNQ